MTSRLSIRARTTSSRKLQEEREEFITRIETSSRLVGQLETKVLQLEAPRHDTIASRTPSDHAAHTVM